MPQLERCCYVSFGELILSCSIFKKIDSCRVSSDITVLDKDLKRKDVQINMMKTVNVLMKCNWIEKMVLALCPLSSYLTP